MPVPTRRICAATALILFVTGCQRHAATDGRSNPSFPTASRSTADKPTAPPESVHIPDYYRQPATPGTPGQLIHSEPLTGTDEFRAWRILYHSTDIHGADIAVSGMVVIPTAAPPAGGRTIITWAHGTTGSGDSCAPSVQTDPTSSIEDLAPLVNQGYIVTATDYPGLGTPGPHPYLVGNSEARSVLDAARAARQLLQADASDHVISWGHSQGGQAVLYAAQIAAAYAPDLKLLGTVAAAPAADVPTLLRSISATTDYGVGYLVLAAAGYAAIDPRADLTSIMTAQGRALLPTVEAGCDTTTDVFTAFNRMRVTDAFTSNPLNTPPWTVGFENDSAGTATINTPLLVVQGGKDTSVPEPITAKLVERLTAMHDVVTYRTYPNANHDRVIQAAQADINDWIRARAGR